MKHMGICGIVIVVFIGFVVTACDMGSGQKPILTGSVSIIGNPRVGQILIVDTANLDGNGATSFDGNTTGAVWHCRPC